MSGNQDVAITVPDTDEIELTIRSSGPASDQGGEHLMPQTTTQDPSEIEVTVGGEDAPLLAGNTEVIMGERTQSPGAGQGAENQRQDGEPASQIAASLRRTFHNVDPNYQPSISPSISRIHPQIRDQDPNSYEPQLISIGPFHYGKQALEPMQRLKWKYLHDLLRRFRGATLEDCVSAVLAVEKEARSYYSEDVALDHTEFVNMLVLDGCFILEFLIKQALGPVGPPFNHAKWNWALLRNDLLLLENQIPFPVLLALFDLVTARALKPRSHPLLLARTDGAVYINIKGNALSLMDIALLYINRGSVVGLGAETQQVFHLLHLFQLCILANSGTPQKPTPPRLPTKIMRWVSSKLITSFYFVVSLFLYLCSKPRCATFMTRSYSATIPSASELREAGVGFVKKNGGNDRQYCLDVSFKNGTIEMPTLTLVDSAKSQFRNLIALEECSRQVVSRVTPFAVFMDYLVDTAEDVAILEEHGVLVGRLGSNEEVASFFNKLCSHVHVDSKDHYLNDLFNHVREYCESDQHRWRAQLVHDYFRNPWAAISVVAAAVLLLLTIAQVVLAVLSYAKQ